MEPARELDLWRSRQVSREMDEREIVIPDDFPYTDDWLESEIVWTGLLRAALQECPPGFHFIDWKEIEQHFPKDFF